MGEHHGIPCSICSCKPHCFISGNTKTHIPIKTVEEQSIKSISKDCSVSDTTIQRIMNEDVKAYKHYCQTFLNHLFFDEFKYANRLEAVTQERNRTTPYINYTYYRLFDQRLEASIVQEMLAYDSRLRTNNISVDYVLYQCHLM
ncbi:transposase family protein [Paraliobacillus sp. JSM ZJ581]|uniref:transposase family protein n=1 Tax=Paraliobacillus sp. JSM ZJ581 TaxID=3342118 RepID=UPI0035A9A4FF